MGTPRKQLASLPREAIGKCLATVELALQRANRDEAVAAINRAFADSTPEVIDLHDGRLFEIGIDAKACTVLARAGIETISQLCACTSGDLLAIGQIGPLTVAQISERLASFRLRLQKSPLDANRN